MPRVLLLSLLCLASGAAAPALAAQSARPTWSAPAPPLDAILDTAALRTALAALPSNADAPRAMRMMTIAYDSAGTPLPPRPTVPTQMPAAMRDTLVALLTALVRPTASRGAPWDSDIQFVTGAAARVERTTRVIRPASVSDVPRLRRRLQTVTERMMQEDESLVDTERAMRLRVSLTSEGLVSDVTVTVSSGRADIDAEAVKLVRQTLFVPLLVEGEPTATEVTLPLRFIFGE